MNEELLEQVRMLPCTACLHRGNYREAMAQALEGGRKTSHPHHLISRGAGGDDIATNLVPLCALHHAQIHQIGIDRMSLKYPTFGTWLKAAGWVKIGNKWRPG